MQYLLGQLELATHATHSSQTSRCESGMQAAPHHLYYARERRSFRCACVKSYDSIGNGEGFPASSLGLDGLSMSLPFLRLPHSKTIARS